MAFTIREEVIIETTELITDGPNQHIRAQVSCTDGPPDYDVKILSEAARRALDVPSAKLNPDLILAGHIRPYSYSPGRQRSELALTHFDLAAMNSFIFLGSDALDADMTHEGPTEGSTPQVGSLDAVLFSCQQAVHPKSPPAASAPRPGTDRVATTSQAGTPHSKRSC